MLVFLLSGDFALGFDLFYYLRERREGEEDDEDREVDQNSDADVCGEHVCKRVAGCACGKIHIVCIGDMEICVDCEASKYGEEGKGLINLPEIGSEAVDEGHIEYAEHRHGVLYPEGIVSEMSESVASEHGGG